MHNPISILVVDDSLLDLQVIVGYLRQYFEVHATTSGERALEMIVSHKPNIVLLDVNMPDVDGYEVCRRIRERDKHLKIIFISAYDSTTEILKGYGVGGNDYIVKPYEPVILLSKIKQVVADETEYEQASHSSAGLAMEAMTSFGELGSVLTFLRSSFRATTVEGLAQLMLKTLDSYGLQGCLQLRTSKNISNFSNHGSLSPIEEELLSRIGKMTTRFAEGGSRMFINYEHASLMLINVPFDDDVKVGRTRDNIALMLEGADERLAMISIELGIKEALELVRKTHQTIVADHITLVERNMEYLKNTLLNMGLEERQKLELVGVIQSGKFEISLNSEKIKDIEVQIEKVYEIIENNLKEEKNSNVSACGFDLF